MTAGPELRPPAPSRDSELPLLDAEQGGDETTISDKRLRRAFRRLRAFRFSRTPGLTPRRYLILPALLLLAGAFAQRPGKVVSDTKVALALNPGQFLSGALHLWNPATDSGSIGDQSNGYLIPMGPFFLLTHALGIPTATAQRLWLGLLLVIGFWGVVRLADALGIGNRTGRILGGLAYVLSPFVMSRIGDNSALLLGDVMLPWALLPLVRVTSTPQRSPKPLSTRRAAALSGIAVLLTGGINATVTLAMLVVPAIWLAFMCRGRSAWILRAWWVGAVVCATAWWVISLQLLGKYGLDFVRYTESAKTTTSVTSLPETLRGTADWLAYLKLPNPDLPSAWTYISAPAAITASFLLVAIGFAGLSRLQVPARRFLLITLAVGVVAIGGAYAGTPHGVLAGTWLKALSGPLGALRNLTKFQPLIRLPIALGLANCLPLLAFRGLKRWRRRLGHAGNGITAAVLAATVVIGAAPLGLSRLYEDGSFAAVPSYWVAATSWLNKASNGSRTLLVPGSGFGTYAWGSPGDEPMLWLSKTPWAVRNIIPLGGVNSTRWLDGIEKQLAQRATPALAKTLARAGFGYVLVRNDLPKTNPDVPPSTDEVHTALANSGLKRVAAFGPLVTGRRTGIQGFLKTKATPGLYPSLEIYALPGAQRVDSYPASSLAVLSGGSEALPSLAAGDVLGDRPTVTASDLAAGYASLSGLTASAWLDTDTLQRRDEQFGSIHSGDSYLLGPGQQAAGESGSPSVRLDVDPTGHQTTAGFTGIKSVTASNYGFVLGASPQSGPQAAVDGDPSTAWSVAGFSKNGVGQWLQVSFPKPVTVPYITLSVLAQGGKKRTRITSVRLTTDAGTRVAQLRNTPAGQPLAIPLGPTKTLRITIASVAPGSAKQTLYGPGISELTVPGITIEQSVDLPNDVSAYFPGGVPATVSYLFARDRADPHNFLDIDVERQITRTFTVPAAASFIATGTAVDRQTKLPASIKGSTIQLACGSGPLVEIDSKKYQTYLFGSRAKLTAGQPIALGLCTASPIKLAAGRHTLRTAPDKSLHYQGNIGIDTLELTAGSTSIPAARPVSITSWGDEKRQVHLDSGAQTILTVHENFNRSWTATANGKQLTAIRIDGWQQGFVVPAGGAVNVDIVNTPGESYRRLLLLTALLVLVLLAAAAWPSRRGRRPVTSARSRRLLITRPLALVAACGVTVLVAGPYVALAVPLLALPVWFLPRTAALLAFAGVAVSGAMTLAHQQAYPSSHQGSFGTIGQVSMALALAVVILCAGHRARKTDAIDTVRVDLTKAVKPAETGVAETDVAETDVSDTDNQAPTAAASGPDETESY